MLEITWATEETVSSDLAYNYINSMSVYQFHIHLVFCNKIHITHNLASIQCFITLTNCYYMSALVYHSVNYCYILPSEVLVDGLVS